MSTAGKVSRRTVAWGIPAISLAVAAPALATSPCATVTVISSTKNTNGTDAKTVTIVLSITGTDDTSIRITDISGGGQGAATWTLPADATISAGGATEIVARENNASGDYVATYLLMPSGQTGTFSFTV